MIDKIVNKENSHSSSRLVSIIASNKITKINSQTTNKIRKFNDKQISRISNHARNVLNRRYLNYFYWNLKTIRGTDKIPKIKCYKLRIYNAVEDLFEEEEDVVPFTDTKMPSNSDWNSGTAIRRTNV